jgi:hypothetical protein
VETAETLGSASVPFGPPFPSSPGLPGQPGLWTEFAGQKLRNAVGPSGCRSSPRGLVLHRGNFVNFPLPLQRVHVVNGELLEDALGWACALFSTASLHEIAMPKRPLREPMAALHPVCKVRFGAPTSTSRDTTITQVNLQATI